MSKRLQVLVSEEEYESLRIVANRSQLTIGEWVRGALRQAVAEADVKPADEKLLAIQMAIRHNFANCDIDQMNSEILNGALSGLH